MNALDQYHPVVAEIMAILTKGAYWHEVWEHEPVTTSEEAAKVRHGYSLSQGAKAIIIRFEKAQGPESKQYAMLVLPGDAKIDNKKVRQLLGLGKFSFANPEELTLVTRGVERGGVPPWGNLFALNVYADSSLSRHEKIIFNAGDRRFSIAMKYRDYVALVQPTVVDITAS